MRQVQSRPLNSRLLQQVLSEHAVSIRNLTERKKEWLVGQWLDVKDTVGQWLEGQVIQVEGDSVFVHYIGWPERWDEWIHTESERLQVFRTKTTQTLGALPRSPIPATPPSTNMEVINELTLAENANNYVTGMKHTINEWYSLEDESSRRRFCTENSGIIDRIGRFLTDSARLIAKDPEIRLVQTHRN